MSRSEAVPFCGLPPMPGELAWNAEPVLIAALLAGLALGWRAAADRRALLAGWGILALALASPLCGLAVALFSARVGQHMAVMLLAAPVIAAALPARVVGPRELALSALAFAATLWFWHLPAPYGWTFASDAAWWAMHASLLIASIHFWWGAMHAGRMDAALLSGLATAAQMGALGAFLTFAPRPLFAPHALTTLSWGLTPLEDQQLGGLLMWVPGGIAFAALALLALSRGLRASPDQMEA